MRAPSEPTAPRLCHTGWGLTGQSQPRWLSSWQQPTEDTRLIPGAGAESREPGRGSQLVLWRLEMCHCLLQQASSSAKNVLLWSPTSRQGGTQVTQHRIPASMCSGHPGSITFPGAGMSPHTPALPTCTEGRGACPNCSEQGIPGGTWHSCTHWVPLLLPAYSRDALKLF